MFLQGEEGREQGAGSKEKLNRLKEIGSDMYNKINTFIALNFSKHDTRTGVETAV
jgi:hypothetical protein